MAYLTAQITLTQAGFERGKTVLAPAIGGAVGNAVTQRVRAQGGGRAISTTTNPAKAKHARALGFDGVIESVGGALTGQALATLALNGVLASLGYSAGRQTTIDVTDLIWKRARMNGFALAAQSHAIEAAAWATILPLLASGRVKPIVERTYRLDEAAEGLRHLIEDRPFGRVVLVG